MNPRTSTQPIELPPSDAWVQTVSQKAATLMQQHESCAQSVLAAFMDTLGIGDPMVLRSAGAMFCGMTASLTCGIHSAGLMVLGLLMGREQITEGLDGLLPIVQPAQELVSRLNQRLGSHSCRELTGVDFYDHQQAWAFYASDGHQKCIARVAEGAEEIASAIRKLHETGVLFRPVL